MTFYAYTIFLDMRIYHVSDQLDLLGSVRVFGVDPAAVAGVDHLR